MLVRELLLVELGDMVAFFDEAGLVGFIRSSKSGDEGFVGDALGFESREAGGGCRG